MKTVIKGEGRRLTWTTSSKIEAVYSLKTHVFKDLNKHFQLFEEPKVTNYFNTYKSDWTSSQLRETDPFFF